MHFVAKARLFAAMPALMLLISCTQREVPLTVCPVKASLDVHGIPKDVCPPHEMEDFGNMAWQTFKTLVWPASSRGVADRSRRITNPGNRPDRVDRLRTALTGANVRGTVEDLGNPLRQVEIRTYPGTGNIIIPIPTEAMALRDWKYLEGEWDAGRKTYPLPDFYSSLFQGNPPAKVLTRPELRQIAKRRLGEYVINECM